MFYISDTPQNTSFVYEISSVLVIHVLLPHRSNGSRPI